MEKWLLKELPQKKKMEVSRDVDSALYVQPGLERRSGTQIVPMESVPFGGKEPVLSTQCQSVIGHWLSPYIPGQWRGGYLTSMARERAGTSH